MYGEQQGKQKLLPRMTLADAKWVVQDSEGSENALQRDTRLLEMIGLLVLREGTFVPQTLFKDNFFSLGNVVKLQKPRLNKSQAFSSP